MVSTENFMQVVSFDPLVVAKYETDISVIDTNQPPLDVDGGTSSSTYVLEIDGGASA